VRIATWNVNSVRARLPRLLDWLERSRPDVACLQETKVVDADFPAAEIEALGYRCLVNGQKTYNGVAILSRQDARELARGLPGDGGDAERRLIAAEVAGVTVVNVYVPNGGDVGLPKYDYKLAWLGRLPPSSTRPATRAASWCCAATSTLRPTTGTSGTPSCGAAGSCSPSPRSRRSAGSSTGG